VPLLLAIKLPDTCTILAELVELIATAEFVAVVSPITVIVAVEEFNIP
jgi:hypothetical protein